MPNTHPPDAPGYVDTAWYLSRYPDVAAAGQDPADHYKSYGRAEGRYPNAAAEDAASLRAQVDPVWYRERYPDVAASDMDPADHYLSYGRAEGRFPDAATEKIAVVRPQVDPVWYRERYPDVGAGDMDPVDHYLRFGQAEGRFPDAVAEERAVLRTQVDPVWYRERYAGEIDAAQDPIDHYILKGRFEGRFPNEAAEVQRLLAHRIDVAWYLRRYPDIAQAGRDPVEHYLAFGVQEGRAPNALAEEYRNEPQTIFEALLRKIFFATTGRDATGPEKKAWHRKLKLGLDYSSIQAALEGSRDLAGQAAPALSSATPDGTVALSEADFRDYLLMFHDRFLGRAPRDDEYLKYMALKAQGSRLSDILETIEFGEEAQKLRTGRIWLSCRRVSSCSSCSRSPSAAAPPPGGRALRERACAEDSRAEGPDRELFQLRGGREAKPDSRAVRARASPCRASVRREREPDDRPVARAAGSATG